MIPTLSEYKETMKIGLEVAGMGYLVTFGIKPKKPETGYGYIKAGENIHEGAYKAERFIEKPSLEKAMRLLEEGGYYWNSRMFAFRARVFEEELRKYLPEV